MAQTQILLACYNGRSYLDAQIRSVVSQSEADWQLLMRDDGSFDGTNAILRAWAQRDARIRLLADHKATGGAMTNFRLLAAAATAPYVMFCDQDDVWHPDKLQKTQRKMRAMERQFGTDTPILVHSDLRVVDQDGREIAPSMAGYQKLDLMRTSFCQLLSQNVVTGCTVMANRALMDLAGPWPDQAVMHDWYLALVAACFGKIGLVEEATIDYRQHGHNQVGSKNAASAQYVAKRATETKKSRQVLLDTYAQAGAFVAQYGEKMPPAYYEAACAFAAMPQKHKLARLYTLAKYRLWKGGLVRKIGQCLYS